MNAFMLYMSGSGVQIFSMMVVGMLLTNPLKAILSIRTCMLQHLGWCFQRQHKSVLLIPVPRPLVSPPTAFAPYLTPGQSMSVMPQQLVFIACQLMCMGLGVYKCWSMGLLPTESSDWLAWREPRAVSSHLWGSIRHRLTLSLPQAPRILTHLSLVVVGSHVKLV